MAPKEFCKSGSWWPWRVFVLWASPMVFLCSCWHAFFWEQLHLSGPQMFRILGHGCHGCHGCQCILLSNPNLNHGRWGNPNTTWLSLEFRDAFSISVPLCFDIKWYHIGLSDRWFSTLQWPSSWNTLANRRGQNIWVWPLAWEAWHHFWDIESTFRNTPFAKMFQSWFIFLQRCCGTQTLKTHLVILRISWKCCRPTLHGCTLWCSNCRRCLVRRGYIFFKDFIVLDISAWATSNLAC